MGSPELNDHDADPSGELAERGGEATQRTAAAAVCAVAGRDGGQQRGRDDDGERLRGGGQGKGGGGTEEEEQAPLLHPTGNLQGSTKRSADFVKQQPGRAGQKN